MPITAVYALSCKDRETLCTGADFTLDPHYRLRKRTLIALKQPAPTTPNRRFDAVFFFSAFAQFPTNSKNYANKGQLSKIFICATPPLALPHPNMVGF
jgi:hypothetical protein